LAANVRSATHRPARPRSSEVSVTKIAAAGVVLLAAVAAAQEPSSPALEALRSTLGITG